MINIYNATFIEIEACPRTLRTTLVYINFILLDKCAHLFPINDMCKINDSKAFKE
jgi:hypothetical protein